MKKLTEEVKKERFKNETEGANAKSEDEKRKKLQEATEAHLKGSEVKKEQRLPLFEFKKYERLSSLYTFDETASNIFSSEPRLPRMIFMESLSLKVHASFDRQLPDLGSTSQVLHIPKYNLPKALSLLPYTKFDISVSALIRNQSLRIPLFALIENRALLVDSRLDHNVSQELVELILTQKLQKEGLQPVMTPPSIGNSSSGEEEPEPRDILEAYFKCNSGKIQSRGPKLILLYEESIYPKGEKDDTIKGYVTFLEHILLRVLRERHGNSFYYRKVSSEFSQNDDQQFSELTWQLFRALSNNPFLLTMDLMESEKSSDFEGLFCKKEFINRLEEFFLAKDGFILIALPGSGRSQSIINATEKLEKTRGIETIIMSIDKELPTELAGYMWGYLGTPSKENFSEYFEEKKAGFYDALVGIQSEEDGLYRSVTQRHNGEESDLHYMIKTFIVRYLTKSLRKKGHDLKTRKDIMELIKTEKPAGSDGKEIPDVQAGNEVYEVETLFGEGWNSIKKIEETIEKYENGPENVKINIVMDNFGFILHLQELIMMRKIFFRDKLPVEFCTLNLETGSLISLKDVVHSIRNVVELDLGR